jgi:hypothetical protein
MEIPNQVALTGGVLLALFVTLILGAILWATLHERRQRRALHDELHDLGFTEVLTPPANLIDKVSALHGGNFRGQGRERGSQPLTLRNVFHRPIEGGDLYLFDAEDGNGDSSGGGLSKYLAIVAPALRLPRLALVPELNLTGAMRDLLGGVARNALNWASTSKGLQPIALDGMPGFEEHSAFTRHYTVMGLDDVAVRDFLTPARLDALLALDHKYAIEGEDDVLMLWTGVAAAMAVQSGLDDASIDVYSLQKDAKDLLALLGESSHPVAG